jgi:hypothetical protein
MLLIRCHFLTRNCFPQILDVDVPVTSLDELSTEGFSNKEKTSLQIVELFLGVAAAMMI